MQSQNVPGYDTAIRVMKLISSELKDLPPRNDKEAHFYQVRAASRFGYSLPFNEEQSFLNSFLESKNADKDLTEKAWELYSRLSRS